MKGKGRQEPAFPFNGYSLKLSVHVDDCLVKLLLA